MLSSELSDLLARKRALDSHVQSAAGFAARLRELRAWQGRRFAGSYDDLRRQRRFAEAVEFFLSDVYEPRDAARRDQDLKRALNFLEPLLPEAALRALLRSIELDVLTAELDQEMVAHLSAGAITEASYGRAYRTVGRADARSRQIELLLSVIADLDGIARHAWIGLVLGAAQLPARAAGFGVLQSFLERGFRVFQRMGGAGELLRAIREREVHLMESLFNNRDKAAPCA